MDRYYAVLQDWLSSGVAYRCFCTPEVLDAERKAALAAGLAPKYSGRCRDLPREESARRVAAGESAAVRFVCPPAAT
jgi:glutamyl/glutaminyl-tRNA synthetase